jgi:hypothetical protein
MTRPPVPEAPRQTIRRDPRSSTHRDDGSPLQAGYGHEVFSIDGACTNGAESYFSRLRRGELGHHHHIAGPYLVRYAREAAWREDFRRVSNGEQVDSVVELAMRCRPSVDFCGYWQRAHAA